MVAVATHQPAPPSAVNPKVPAELSALVMNLLEKDPAKRVGSAAEVVKVLQSQESKPRSPEVKSSRPAAGVGQERGGSAAAVGP